MAFRRRFRARPRARKVRRAIFRKKWAKFTKKLNINHKQQLIGLGLPKTCFMTHKYVEQIQMTSTTGGYTAYKFRANDLYDPNFTSTGHQPYYYDTMQALYTNFTVLGSRIKVTVVQAANNNVSGIMTLLMNPYSANPADTDPVNLAERNLGTYKVLSGGNAGQALVKLYSTFSLKKQTNKYQANDPDYQGSSASPTKGFFYVLDFKAMDTSTNIVNVIVEIEYFTKWSGLIDQVSS